MVSQTDELGKKAALLSIVEMGLGSVLHGLKIPLAGFFLSLNQVFILSWSTRIIPERTTPGILSNTAALLKSLSPAGKKLNPMLAIAIQGQLFGLGLMAFGTNLLGHLLGAALAALWGIVQPLLLYALLYGSLLFDIAGFLLQQLQQVFPVTTDTLMGVFIAFVVTKVLLSFFCVWLAYRLKVEQLEAYQNWAQSQKPVQKKITNGPAWLLALKDLFTPLFIVSWLVTVLFLFFAQHDAAPSVWVWMRPLAVGYLIFLALRLLPKAWLQTQLMRRSPLLAQTLRSALKIVGR